MSDVQKVKKNISEIYIRRKAALFALSGSNALDALLRFKRAQAQNTFWNNESSDALNRMFTKPFTRGDIVGFRMAHGVFYGVFLEKANDGRHEAIRPIMGIQAKIFFKQVKELY